VGSGLSDLASFDSRSTVDTGAKLGDWIGRGRGGLRWRRMAMARGW
jgi:hypothetical protein